jgi:hypothetical protein
MSLNPSIFKNKNLDDSISFNPALAYLYSAYSQSVYVSENNMENKDGVFNFCSDSKKAVISLQSSFFHFYTESFSTLILAYKKYSDIEVIIVDPFIEGLSLLNNILDRTEVQMFFIFLIDNNISYKIVSINDINNSTINNFFICDYFSDDSRNQAEILSLMSKEYVVETENSHKAYIRSGRVINEDILETYLMQYGFDIIDRYHFDNFIDQMIYYYNCNILISATCGGLVNSSFMKSGSLVIELVTPVQAYIPKDSGPLEIEEIHHIYDTLSLQKDHLYIGVSNVEKSAEDILVQFNVNKFLKEAIQYER